MQKNKKTLIVLSGFIIAAGIALFFIGGRKHFNMQAVIQNSLPFSKAASLVNKFEFTKHDPTKIGWISDIHADRFKRRDINSGLMFPRQYSNYLPKVFEEMRKQGIDTVIATRDNTNSGDENYSLDLKRIADENNMNVIWVKGNHDNDKVMSDLGVRGSKYYFKDKGNTRIIVLDDVENDGGYYGSIDQTQLDWLKEVLKTDKQVIVAMHIPIFEENDLASIHDLKKGDWATSGQLLERYAELENILHSAGNVKLVISGHWHLPWHKEYQGVNYYGEAALTREGFSGAYGIINLNDDSINYLFAKL